MKSPSPHTRRFAGLMTNMGVLTEFLFPKEAGRDYEATPYLEILIQVARNIAYGGGVLEPWSKYQLLSMELPTEEPGARLVMSTDQGPFPMETTYTWHDTPDGGTHMTLRNRGEPSGFANLAAPLMSAQMRKSTTRDLQLLKSLMERRPNA